MAKRYCMEKNPVRQSCRGVNILADAVKATLGPKDATW